MCATDAGREGELIFRYIYEAAGCAQAGQPAVDLVADAGGDPPRLRQPAARRGVRSAGRRRPRTQPGGLAGGDEPLARLHAGLRRRISRWAGCRRRPWRCWWSASWRSGSSSPRTTSKWWPRFHPQRAPRPINIQGHVVARPAALQGDKESLRRRCGCRPTARRPSSIVERARTGQAGDRVHRSADAAHAAAAALRPHRAAAPRQPAVRLQRAEDAGHGAGAVRAAQADQLSAHRQPAPVAGRRGHAAAVVRRSQSRIASTWRRGRASGRWASGSSTTPRSPTTTPSSRPRPAASRHRCRPRSARSTTWSAGGCSARGTRTTSGR